MPNIVVIGASAGGVEPLREIIRSLTAKLPAAVFVVMHLSASAPSALAQILSVNPAWKVTAATDGETIEPTRIYVAKPDLHMLVEPGRIRLTHGPRENRYRPSIDSLFRTAAWAYGPRVVGVVLTGSLDDGTVGLYVIKHEGGMAVVQDPKDALFPSMPESAIRQVPVDFILPAAQIGQKVVALVNDRWTEKEPSKANEIARDIPSPEGEKMKVEEDERWMGKPSPFTCPDCNGTLWEMEDGGLLRFRCRVGHAFSGDGVRAGYTESVEAALRAAVRPLEESAALEMRLGELALERGDKKAAARFKEVANGRQSEAQTIRSMLLSKLLSKRNSDAIFSE